MAINFERSKFEDCAPSRFTVSSLLAEINEREKRRLVQRGGLTDGEVARLTSIKWREQLRMSEDLKELPELGLRRLMFLKHIHNKERI